MTLRREPARLLLWGLLACQGERATPLDDAAVDGTSGTSAQQAAETPATAEQVIDRLGAISAWQAVVDRAQYLARRGQRGVVYGRVGPEVEETIGSKAPKVRWLVDDTEGGGMLGIRVSGMGSEVAGARVAVSGSWIFGVGQRWVWKAEGIQSLPSAKRAQSPVAERPGLDIATEQPPADARLISLAQGDDTVIFSVVAAPLWAGAAWAIADAPKDPPVAYLSLLGERASYGGMDMRSADERWQLRVGGRYWVRVGKLRRRAKAVIPWVSARAAPVALPQ